MTTWFEASNMGELDPLGLRLMGASTKRDDPSKIGFFGTGFKYALAVLLRNGADVRVFSGTSCYRIKTQKVSMRGKEFEEIVIVGPDGTETPTGMTTDVGPKWELWMALREIICNALDEPGGGKFEVVETEPVGFGGETRVYISYEVVRSVWEEKEKYFRLDRTVALEVVTAAGEKGRILSKVDDQTRVYRKGILVFADKTPSMFDYDCPDLRVSEERLASGWEVKHKVWEILNWASVERKKEILANLKPFEENLPEGWMYVNPDWSEALGETIIVTPEQAAFFREELFGKDTRVLPGAWVTTLRREVTVQTAERALTSGAMAKPVKRGLDGTEKRGIKEALRVLKKVGIDIDGDSVLVVQTFEDPNVLGKFENGKMLLARRLFDLGFRELIKTIVEEWAHDQSKAADKTREFQNFLLDTLVSVIGKASKRVL